MDGRTWTLRTAVVLSVGLLDPSLSVYRDGFLSFSVSVLWLFSVVSPGGHGWTMLTSYVDTFWNFDV